MDGVGFDVSPLQVFLGFLALLLITGLQDVVDAPPAPPKEGTDRTIDVGA